MLLASFFLQKHYSAIPREFVIFCRIPGMIMVKVTPTYIKSWVRIDNKFFIEHLDLKSKAAYLEKPED